MEFLVLLSVLAITQTSVMARPSNAGSKTKRSTEDVVFKPASIKLPVQLENGFTVIVNGSLDTKSDKLEVVFPSGGPQESQCRMTYDYSTYELDMAPEKSSWIPKYELFSQEEHPRFSIILTAWTINDNHLFKLTFDSNKGDNSSQMTCNLARFEDFQRIEFLKGVHSITNVFFTVDLSKYNLGS